MDEVLNIKKVADANKFEGMDTLNRDNNTIEEVDELEEYKPWNKRIKNPFLRFVVGFFRIIFKTIWFIIKSIFTLIIIGCLTAVIFSSYFLNYVGYDIFKTGEADVTLMDIPVNLSSTIYYYNQEKGDWEEWYKLDAKENRTWTSYDDIPVDFIHSFVAIEDQRFYTHHGVDWRRTAGAALSMATGKKIYGGSTITQQLLKNVTQDNEVTIKRKIIEICRALKLEQTYTKEQILEWYVNVIYFGRHNYGIAEASHYYFNKEVSELTLAEMCSITGITNNPSLYDPYNHPENNKKRQEIILNKMCELGYIDEKTCNKAKKQKIEFYDHKGKSSGTNTIYPYYVDAVINDVINCFMEQYGIDNRQASSMLFNGGYNIYTCVDMSVQKKMDSVYQDRNNMPSVYSISSGGLKLQSGMIIIDPYTGDIVGMEGGIGEKKVSRGLNWATSSMARRPLGSSIKPLAVYGPAIDMGLISPDTYFNDYEGFKLEHTDWYPNNVTLKHYGYVTVRQALVQSMNTIAAQIEDKVTAETSYDILTNQFHMNLEPEDCDYAPMAVGQLSIGTTAREVASAYTVFPNSGTYIQGRTFLKITDSDNNLVYYNKPVTEEVFNEKTAYWITNMLQDAVKEGSGYEARLNSMPCAGKTGTTDSKRDKWFAGYTPYYVGVVWSGFETPQRIDLDANPSSLTWKKVMELIHEDLEYKEFYTPEDVELGEVELQNNKRPSSLCYRRGVTVDGDEIYYESIGWKWDNNTTTIYAKELDGYTLVSGSSQKLYVEDDGENTVTFVYSKNIGYVEPQSSDETNPSGENSESNTSGENGDNQDSESNDTTEANTTEVENSNDENNDSEQESD